MAKAYLGLGSNLGDRQAHLRAALERLKREAGPLVALSAVYETEPVSYKDQPWFLNLACCIQTTLSPSELLDLAKRIEKELGRARQREIRFGPRPIDIDILFYDDLILDSPPLTIPHPRLHERGFVLIPLNEIAPQLRHPRLGLTIAQLRESWPGHESVQRYGELNIQ